MRPPSPWACCRPGEGTAPTASSWRLWERQSWPGGAARGRQLHSTVSLTSTREAALCANALETSHGSTLLTLHPTRPGRAAWRDTAQRLAYQRQVVSAAATRLRQRELCQAWAAWRQRVAEQQQKCAKLERAVHSWRQGALRAAWASWRDGLQRQREKHARLQAAMRLWQHHQLRSAWAAWQEFSAFRRHARAVLARFTQQALPRAFTSWREAASRRAQLAAKLASAVARMRNRSLAAAFAGEVNMPWLAAVKATAF